jgi:hypothetical protein
VDPELLIYWQADFPDLTCGRNFLCWLGAAWSRFGRYFFSDWGAPLGFIFFAVGLGYLFRSDQPRVIWYFFGPILVTLAAAIAERYPFMGHAGGVRLMMFSAPLLYLVTGAGLAALYAWLWQRQSQAAAAHNSLSTPPPDNKTSRGLVNIRTRFSSKFYRIAMIIYLGVVLIWLQPIKLWQENLHPQANREEIGPLVHYLQNHQRPGDAIYVYYFAIYPFRFYFQGPQDHIIWGQSCHDRCLPLTLEDVRRIERLWMIFSHFETEAEVDRFIADLLGQGWTRQLAMSQPGAVLFCYLPPHAKPATIGDKVKPPGP